MIRSHHELEVYQRVFRMAVRIFEVLKGLPKEERYSLIDQITRVSRCVRANLAEAWRKRRYAGALLAKLSDSEAEAAETQTWLNFAVECGYLDAGTRDELSAAYDRTLGKLVSLIHNPGPWLVRAGTQWG